MKYLLFFTIIFYLSCTASSDAAVRKLEFSVPDGWQRIEECGVSFYISPDTKENSDVRGGDSCFREYVNQTMLLELDVLFYPTTKDSKADMYSNRKEFYLEKVMLDDKSAEIITFKTEKESLSDFEYITFLHVPRMVKNSSLNMYWASPTIEEREKVIQIIKTVRGANQ